MFKIIALETISRTKEFLRKELDDRVPQETKQLEVEDNMGAPAIQDILWSNKEARYNSVMRLLGYKTKNHVYKFYRNYDVKERKAVKISEPKICDDYFNGDGKSKINISLCAIVGENGSGKSTILELILRLLNNMAYALQNGIDSISSAPLFFAECVFARLFFENGEGEIFCIEQDDLTIRLINTKNEEEIFKYSHRVDKDGKEKGLNWEKEKCREILKSLFYTIEVNYSAYSLNIEDFRYEWIDNDENKIYDEYRIYTDNQINRAYDEKCWIDSLFHKNDAYQTPIVLNPYRERGNIDINNEKELLNDRLFLMFVDNKAMISALLGGKEPQTYIFDRNHGFWAEYHRGTNNIFCAKKVRDILRELDTKNDMKDTSDIIKEDSKAYVLCEEIINCWQKCYGYKFYEKEEIKDLNLREDDDIIAALNYIVYKTIKVTLTYVHYADYKDVFKECNKDGIKKLVMKLFCDKSHITLKLRRTIALLTFNHYGTKMKKDVSQRHNRMSLDTFSEIITSIIDEQDDKIKDIKKKREIKKYTDDDFKALEPTMSGGLNHDVKWTREELLPAPCLSTTITIKIPQGDEILFNTLSSGERQFVYSLGTMLYQLHNLNITHQDGVRYDCVNLIFDEIELYFHPKYQKQLIKRLIKVINSIGARVIKHVNVIIATHSPFILSDIPKENILYLEDGIDVSEKIEINPFGANIFDLFRSSFFLGDGLIGEYAWEKILQAEKSIKHAISNPNDTKSKDIMPLEEAKKIVKEIGDDRIKDYFFDLLFELEPREKLLYCIKKYEKLINTNRNEQD